MSYLEEFRTQVTNGDLHGVLHLWEEYCSGDVPDTKELIAILKEVGASDLAKGFGEYVELILPLWNEIDDPDESLAVMKAIIDVQTTNSEQLGEQAYEVLRSRFEDQERFALKIRLVGLRDKTDFQGAVSNYILLTHLNQGKFVYHSGGWGAGEVMDYSLIREELTVEFENVVGRKELSFSNAFKYLEPLADDHFLSRRFGSPDDLEKEAREHPVRVITMLLRDLGPKTAAEIKEEMLELVIPTDDWTKWWQNARARLKKDTRVEMPATMKDSFRLRDAALSHGEHLKKKIQSARAPKKVILGIYNFSRDFPEILKSNETRAFIEESLKELEGNEDLPKGSQLEVMLLQDSLFGSEEAKLNLAATFKASEDPVSLVHMIDIVAFKKKALAIIREHRADWIEVFLSLINSISQSALKDFLLKSLMETSKSKAALENSLHNLVDQPAANPDTFVWYFQKLLTEKDIPYSDKDGVCQFFEGLLILFNAVEHDNNYRDLIKKIYGLLTKKRFAIVRSILEGTSEDYVREFLLLVSKIHTLSNHDKKIMQSLAEVVHPSLKAQDTAKVAEEDEPIWTTQAGFDKLKEQIHHIGTVETVENAKEIEAARALGDLRENSEYKFALERRDRLQSQLTMFTEQLNRARVITNDDISTQEVGVGVRAELESSSGKVTEYTLLGPWDADPEKHVLSFQSKLAKAMTGIKVGESFDFQGETFKVKAIHRAI